MASQILQVGQSFQKQDPFDQPVGMLHLVDRLLVFIFVELMQAEVLEHPRVEEILVDCRQLVLEDLVEIGNDFLVAFHLLAPLRCFLKRPSESPP